MKRAEGACKTLCTALAAGEDEEGRAEGQGGGEESREGCGDAAHACLRYHERLINMLPMLGMPIPTIDPDPTLSRRPRRPLPSPH